MNTTTIKNIYHCITCSSPMEHAGLFCSAVCLQENLFKRKEISKSAKNIKTPRN